jgi:2-phosphoglycerate kinase
MEPTSDHEREIARRIDELARQGNLPLSAVADIAASLQFTLSKSETQFLVRYILWRRDHPL